MSSYAAAALTLGLMAQFAPLAPTSALMLGDGRTTAPVVEGKPSEFNAAQPDRQVRLSGSQAGVPRWFHSETIQVAQFWPRKWLNSWPRSTAVARIRVVARLLACGRSSGAGTPSVASQTRDESRQRQPSGA